MHFVPDLSAIPFSGDDAWWLIEERCRAGAFAWNLETGHVEWSLGLYRLLGFAEGEIVPTAEVLRGLIHPADRLTEADMEAFIARAAPFARDLRIIRRDGRLRWLNIQYEFLHDERGVVRRMVGVATDITEHHGRRERDRHQADRFKEIVLGVAPILWVAGPGGAIRDVKGWNCVTGRSDNGALGMGWLDCVHEDDRDRARAALVSAHSHAFDAPIRVMQAAGGYRWFQPHAAPKTMASGEIVEWAGLLVDVDQVHRTELASRDLTGAQIRAARAILNWSVSDLCAASALTGAVVRRLEAHDGVPPRSASALEAIRRAAERGGVEFLVGSSAELPGVRPAGHGPSGL